MADSVSATQIRSPILKRIAEALEALRSGGDAFIPNPFEGSVMDPGRIKGAGSLFVGKAPEAAERLAYGESPLKLKAKGVGSRIPELREDRVGDLFDLASMTPAGIAASAAKTAGPMSLAAIKAVPGGHWTNSSMRRMAELLKGGGGGDAPEHVQQWLDRAVPRYFQKHAGTSRDPARTLNVGETNYENWMDRSLRRRAYEDIPPDEVPMNARAGEDVWNFNPRPPLADYLRHAGDFAQTIAPEDLARMDVPTLLQQSARQVQRAGRQVARQNSGAPEEFMPMVARLTGEHPGGPLIEGPGANWYRYDKSMDPQIIRQGLSADTCVGRHCVGGVKTASGEPGFQRGQWLPMIDLRTGNPPPGVSENALSPYARGVMQGDRTYSLRTPAGDVLATAYARQPTETGIPRSTIRDLIGKPTYLNWQKRQAAMGDAIESRKWILPGGRTRVHIGDDPQVVNVGPAQGSPDRGRLSPEQIKSIIAMHPGTEELLKPYVNGPIDYNLEQLKGFMNRPVSPKWQDHTAALLELPELNVKNAAGDLAASGFLKKSKGVMRPRELLEQATDAGGAELGTLRQDLIRFMEQPHVARLLNTPPDKLNEQEAEVLRNLYTNAIRLMK